ncbi:MAG: haloacid dehalogenase-like hydrolase [Rhodospirillaceae bacterium]|nr:haloacid dehalogenase-like hydrolase [Rhodospirillaceae bacterium]
MIRCVVFDFDGTLVLSNAIKRDGFFAVAADFPGGTETMEALLASPPGDRFAIFRAFAASYGAKPDDLASQYGAWCEDKILACPERPGATELLAYLQQQGLPVYINSATPQAPLQSVVAKRYGKGAFTGVLGGHGCKVRNLNTILNIENLSPKDLLMVGDGRDDHDAATEISCNFVGIAGGTLAATTNHTPLISILSELRLP